LLLSFVLFIDTSDALDGWNRRAEKEAGRDTRSPLNPEIASFNRTSEDVPFSAVVLIQRLI